jgi:hypothetical protein
MEFNLAIRAAVLTFVAALVSFGQQQPPAEPEEPLNPATGQQVYVPVPVYRPRAFLQANSHGNNWNSRRDQSMEMSKDFERDCPEIQVTLNQSNADYTVLLNHIEHGFVRDNQFQIADRNGDLLTRTREGGSIKGGVKKACAQILTDWQSKHQQPSN